MGRAVTHAFRRVRQAPFSEVITDLGHQRVCAFMAASEGDDPVERIHQQRVAIRRLRSLLRLITPVTRPDALTRLDEDLSWVASRLEDQRDLDVLGELVRRDVVRALSDEADDLLVGIEVELTRRQFIAHEELHVCITGKRFKHLQLSLRKLDLGAGLVSDDRVDRIAPKLLQAQWKRLKHARRTWLEDDDYGSWHRMRMRTKNLRYVLEDFTPAYPELGSCAGQLGHLTDLMGEVCDAHNEQQFLAAVAVSSDVSIAFTAGRVSAWSELRQRRLIDQLPAHWRKVQRHWQEVQW
jgi:CHAD domain-containing protein